MLVVASKAWITMVDIDEDRRLKALKSTLISVNINKNKDTNIFVIEKMFSNVRHCPTSS